MSYKSVVAVFNSAEDVEPLMAVCRVALGHGGHLIGLHAEVLPAAVVTAPAEIPDLASYQAVQERLEERAKEIEAVFRKIAEREGLSHEWRSFSSIGGETAGAAIDICRSAELILARQLDEKSTENQGLALETVLFETGRPVLVVPYIGWDKPAIRRVLIAWNGSKEAARSVFDAMPFLLGAESIEIFCVDAPIRHGEDVSFAGSDLAETLARHGMKVSVEGQKSAGQPVGSILENRVSDTGTDLLVMGAYSHSRLRERFFGGATKTLLGSMSTLTLMAR